MFAQMARIREQANLLITEELERRSIEGLLPAHGPVVELLLRQDAPLPIKDVVAATGRVKSTVTQVLTGLERKGYVHRTPSTEDNRVVNVALSPKGEALRTHFRAISELLQEVAFRSIPEADLVQLSEVLTQVEDNLRKVRLSQSTASGLPGKPEAGAP